MEEELDIHPDVVSQEGHQQPSLKYLNRYVRDSIGIKWYDLGIELLDSNDVAELDIIEAEHPMDFKKCCTKMFSLWLRKQPAASWNQLIEALRQPGIELITLATNVEQKILDHNSEVPASQSEVKAMPSHDNQPRQDDKRSQVDDNNVINDMDNCLKVKKQFRKVIIMNLRLAYSKVVKKLLHIFKEKKVDIEELITILRFDDVEKNSVFSTDSVFNTIKTEIQLFQCVAQYCKSIFDYEVLKILVQASDCPEAIKELTDFTESLHNSILTEVDLMSEHGELLHPDDFMPGTYKFIIEYVGGKCTIETKEMVQGIVEQSVRLNKGVLIFKGIDSGSILFIYQVSEAVKDYLLEYKFTEEYVVFLEGNRIASLIIDDVKIFSLQPNEEIRGLGEPQETVQLTNTISKQLDELVTSLSPEDREATLSTLRRIFDNIIQHSNGNKYRQIKLTDETFSSKVWQYPAGEELMKMSGWVVEDDHVTLRDDSCVEIVSQLLKSSFSLATGIVLLPDDKFQVLIKAFCNGDIPCIKKLLKISHISPTGRIYSESRSSFNLLEAATIAQRLDIVKLLLTDYSMDPYVMSMSENTSRCYFQDIFNASRCYFQYIFLCAPQSFIIAIMKYFGVKSDFKAADGLSLLHYAVAFNCFDVLCFLLEECSDIDVNVTDDDMYTPLHMAYLYGYKQIAQYLIQHGADEYALNNDCCTPCEYIDGNPYWIKDSEYSQNIRKIHHIPYSIEHCFFMKLVNIGIDVKEAVSLTMERFPSLIEDRPTQPRHDIDHASALKEFTQYITNSTQRSTNDSKKQTPPEVQENYSKISTDHLCMETTICFN